MDSGTEGQSMVTSTHLNASDEGWRVVGENLLISDDAAQEGIEEDGIVLTRRVDGLRSL